MFDESAVHPPLPPARDRAFEDQFFADVVLTAHRLTGITNDSYPGRVQHRMRVGREVYGDDAFMAKDNIAEVMEETPDIAGYAVLELQKQKNLGQIAPDVFEDVRLDLVAASAYGAVADWYAQRAGRRLKGDE
jgi:hypothetical protein